MASVSRGTGWICRPCLEAARNRPSPTWDIPLKPQHSSRITLKQHTRNLSTSRAILAPAPAPAKHFTYNIAASYIGKDRKYDPATHTFHYNKYNRLYPSRRGNKSSRPQSGQDAFFVSRINDTGGIALGVADGVGGWADSGVDPADFSHGICDWMALAAAAYDSNKPIPLQDPMMEGITPGKPVPLTPKRLMQIGFEAVSADSSIRAGGSTACVALFDTVKRQMQVANLGDSGFLHFRQNALHAHSEPQTHAFNTPYQLSVIPERLLARNRSFGQYKRIEDVPRDADASTHALQHGDVLIFATDGVLDNLFHQEMLRIVNGVMHKSGAWVTSEGARDGGVKAIADLERLTAPAADETPKDLVQGQLAVEVTKAALAASINTKVDGPFAKEVRRWYPKDPWRGGKVDDICVVAVVVAEVDGPPPTVQIKSKL